MYLQEYRSPKFQLFTIQTSQLHSQIQSFLETVSIFCKIFKECNNTILPQVCENYLEITWQENS